MKLYPKARPVRIKLVVGEEEHSSLDSLRDNFDIEEIIKLHENGGLRNWLRQINEEAIWKRMEEKKGLDTLKKYEEIFDIFYPGKTLSINARLFYLKEKHYNSFRNLLLLLLKSEESPLSGKEVLQLYQSVAERGDNNVCRVISKWYHEAFESASCGLLDGLKQIIRKRNGEAGTDLDSKFKPEESQLNKNKYSLTQYQKSSIKSERADLEECIDKIMEGKFRVKRSESDIVLSLTVNTTSRYILDDTRYVGFRPGCLYDIDSYVRNLFQNSISDTLKSWKNGILRIFIIGLMLKDYKSILKLSQYSPIHDRFYKISSFLDGHGGRKQLKEEQKKIYFKIGGDVLKNSEGIERLIFQSFLFVSINCLYEDPESISDLCHTGYRPALLQFGLTEPVNALEREFVSLDGIRKVQFLIQHLLEM